MNQEKENDLIKRAYQYGYPIVGMFELMGKKETDFLQFAHTASLATPETSFIPAPNNDTSYSRAWLDLRQNAVLIEVPDTKGRYYSIQILDLYSETVINLGCRLHGTKAQKFVMVGPGFRGELPKDARMVSCDTTFALAFLRILIRGEADLEEVKRIQAGFVIKPIWSRTEEMERVPSHSDTSTYRGFFETLNQILALTPPLLQDMDFLEKLKDIGIGAEFAKEPFALREEVLTPSCELAMEEIIQGGMQFGEEVNFWRIARANIGNYGQDYKQRAVVWHKGALANQPEESLYPSTFQDSKGAYLDGNFSYTITFAKEELPPVSQFWSLTMYIFRSAFLVENEIGRYSIGDRTKGLVYEEDGSLTVTIQSDRPKEVAKQANWLPAPREKFYMTLRLYGPSIEAITGLWEPPAVRKVEEECDD